MLSSMQLLFGSLAIMVNDEVDCRPITLRRRVFPVWRFGRLVDPDQQRVLILDSELCAVTLSRDFAILGSMAVMAQFSFRPTTLRRRVFPVLLFIEANPSSRNPKSNSITHMF